MTKIICYSKNNLQKVLEGAQIRGGSPKSGHCLNLGCFVLGIASLWEHSNIM